MTKSTPPSKTPAAPPTEPWDDEDDNFREPWCKDIVGHQQAHGFCSDHQAAWCRVCDRNGCPQCVDDPHCPECHVGLYSEEHDWDCSYAGDDDDD